jgi:uncharacterized protein (TIGR03437 family)
VEAVGVHRAVPDLSQGSWSDGAVGERVWRFAVSSDGAAGMRVYFTGFDVGQGAVWVYPADAEDPRAEPFTGRGPQGDGSFWSATVFGEEAVIEYRPDPAAPAEGAPPFEVREIAHLWQSPEQLTTPLRSRSRDASQSPLEFLQSLPAAGSRRAAATPNASLIGSSAAPCQVDVACYPEWDETSHAVALILFESGDGSYACSGTLLNTRNQSFDPYFLTAAHCITSNSDAHSVEAFWNFRGATCNAEAPGRSQLVSTLGASQVLRHGDFDDTRGDFSLLLLSAAPDGAVFAGWDPSTTSLGASVVGIHHPSGDQQRITFGTTVQDRFYGASDNYLIVREDLGRTEGGSSGSGLFSADDVLAGVLSFGPALPRNQTVCDINPSYSGYTRFSSIYPEISAYLENQAEPPDDPGPAVTSGESRSFSFDAVRSPTLFEDPTLAVTVPANALSLTIELAGVSPPSADVDLYVRKEIPPAVASGSVTADFSSTGATSAERIVIDSQSSPPLQAGVYYVRLALYTRATAVAGQILANVETSQDGATQPAPSISSIVHAADQRASAVAPGQLVSVYGENLGPAAGVQPSLDANGRIPVTVNGVSVTFGGVPAPILYDSAGQVNVQVPYEIEGLASTAVVVTRDGFSSVPFNVAIAPVEPQIFRYFDGSDRGVVFNQDGAVNSPEVPAARGDIVVFYVTGQGALTPPMGTGELARQAAAPPIPAQQVRVTIGGADAEVLFAGAPAGLAGVMQVNARVPATSVSGADALVSVRVGSVESRAARLAIR